MATRLIKGDPDSATSPSKYNSTDHPSNGPTSSSTQATNQSKNRNLPDVAKVTTSSNSTEKDAKDELHDDDNVFHDANPDAPKSPKKVKKKLKAWEHEEAHVHTEAIAKLYKKKKPPLIDVNAPDFIKNPEDLVPDSSAATGANNDNKSPKSRKKSEHHDLEYYERQDFIHQEFVAAVTKDKAKAEKQEAEFKVERAAEKLALKSCSGFNL